MVLTESNYKDLKHGDSAPDFKLPCTDGKTYSLKDFDFAKAILIVFMCNHCPYVIPKMEELNRITKEYSSQGLIVIGINPNDDLEYPEDSFENMKKIVKQKGLKFFYLRDESQDVARAYGAVCTPDPYLFDSNNKLIYHGRIDDTHASEKPSKHEMFEIIGEYLTKGKITAKEKTSMGCSIKWKE